ncbi:MAG: hypothetical protein ACI33M_02380 [Lysinibacillus sp.]
MEDMIERAMRIRNIDSDERMYCFRLRGEKAVTTLTLAYGKGYELSEAQKAFIKTAKEFFNME